MSVNQLSCLSKEAQKSNQLDGDRLLAGALLVAGVNQLIDTHWSVSAEAELAAEAQAGGTKDKTTPSRRKPPSR
jgi:hypothetical protein